MFCKICGDPIKRCSRRSTKNWCHTWHHDHTPVCSEKISEKVEKVTENILEKGSKLLNKCCKIGGKIANNISDDFRKDAEYRNKRSIELKELHENSEVSSHGWSKGRYIFEEDIKEKKRAKREMNEFFK